MIESTCSYLQPNLFGVARRATRPLVSGTGVRGDVCSHARCHVRRLTDICCHRAEEQLNPRDSRMDWEHLAQNLKRRAPVRLPPVLAPSQPEQERLAPGDTVISHCHSTLSLTAIPQGLTH